MFSLPQLLLAAHHLPTHSTLHFLYLFKKIKANQKKKTVKQKMSKQKERKKQKPTKNKFV